MGHLCYGCFLDFIVADCLVGLQTRIQAQKAKIGRRFFAEQGNCDVKLSLLFEPTFKC